MRFRDEKEISGCAISGIMSETGRKIPGDRIIKSIAQMHERSSGLGGGFAAYGIYPDFADYYAFHVMFDFPEAEQALAGYLKQNMKVLHEEQIPTRKTANILSNPLLRRYFVQPKPDPGKPHETEEDMVVRAVMYINREIEGVFVLSSGKNMGVFKGVGYPEDIGDFFKLEEYSAYIWLAHGRFPTNTTGWWGGAHPFCILDCSVVHNGEISSYGINRRYLENFGYSCTLRTDTEVITYLVDLLLRRHKLPLEIACRAMAPPFWTQIERMSVEDRDMFKMLRIVYGGALLNGPFSILVGHSKGMFGLNDRTKLRPMVAAKKEDMLYVASEEAAIRVVCAEPEKIWHAEGGIPVVGMLQDDKQPVGKQVK